MWSIINFYLVFKEILNEVIKDFFGAGKATD